MLPQKLKISIIPDIIFISHTRAGKKQKKFKCNTQHSTRHKITLNTEREEEVVEEAEQKQRNYYDDDDDGALELRNIIKKTKGTEKE